jgi:hypothetical protein
MNAYVFLASSLIIGAVSVYFIFSSEYYDCVVGRISLSIMAITAFVVGHEYLIGWTSEPLPTTTALLVGMALYMAWLLFRFERRKRRGWVRDDS